LESLGEFIHYFSHPVPVDEFKVAVQHFHTPVEEFFGCLVAPVLVDACLDG
jgi:hypothetical protein